MRAASALDAARLPVFARRPSPSRAILRRLHVKIGVPREIHASERRVAVTPTTAKKLRQLGYEVVIETGAGASAGILDGAFAEVGATIAPDAETLWREADLVVKVRPPTFREDGRNEVDLMNEGGRLIGFVWPAQNKPLVDRLADKKATVLAMDQVPRITRAQKMDALSATANLAGYRAVIEAANVYQSFFGGQMTAAGRVRPAQVLVIGAGVAGLAAVAAARSLGAVVRAFDTRPAVREQVESLGAKFLPLDFKESGEGEGGYAKEMSDAFLAAEQALIATHAKEVDIIITTALIPGKPAPQLITSGAVVSMRPGSVIVDLAAEQGGNCALTEADRVVEKFGVTIIGYTDLPSRMARQASELYATTVFHLIEELTSKQGAFTIDLEDEVHRGALVLDQGALMWPPPIRPKPRAGAPRPEPSSLAKTRTDAHPPPRSAPAKILVFLLAILLAAVGMVAPPDFLEHFTVFLLACVVGWHVIWNVSPALHTPLMSVTNAISGIILVGGILVLRGGGAMAPALLGGAAILLAAINVSGGFLVTQRMLRMFRR